MSVHIQTVVDFGNYKATIEIDSSSALQAVDDLKKVLEGVREIKSSHVKDDKPATAIKPGPA